MFAASLSYYAERITLPELHLLSLGLLNISSTCLCIKHLKFSGLLCVPPSLRLKKFLILPTCNTIMFLMATRTYGSYVSEED